MGLVRILLAVVVVTQHVWPSHRLMSGNTAVEFFFIISGFYMAMICAEHYRIDAWAGVARFYAARFLRLWPAFITIGAITLGLWYIAFFLARPPTSGRGQSGDAAWPPVP